MQAHSAGGRSGCWLGSSSDLCACIPVAAIVDSDERKRRSCSPGPNCTPPAFLSSTTSNADESLVSTVRYARLTERAVVVLSSPPEISVVRPKPFGRWIAVRMGFPYAVVLVAMALLGVRDHNPAAVLGGLAAVGVAALILAIEMPLVLRLQARRQRRVFDTAPHGTLFAARVSQVGTLAGAVSGPASARRGLRQGTLLINEDGISFTSSRRRGVQRDTNLRWQQLSALRLTPSPSKPTGRLKAVTTDGQIVSWLIGHSSCGPLIQALDQIRAQHPINPTG